MIVRLLFLAKYRIPHLLFSLQWDNYIQGVDKTIVCSPMAKDEIWSILKHWNINVDNWDYISDSVIYEKYPQVNDWVVAGDYRGWWLRQQAIKLSYLDLIQQDVMLMWDPDTFLIQPYRAIDNNQLQLVTLLNTTHGSYEGVFKAITGYERPTQHCFVTEYMPVRKNDWINLRNHIQQRWPDRHWLNAIIDAVPGMPTVPPWGNGEIIKWFSEYELLGGWAVLQGNINYWPQARFEYNTLSKLNDLDIKKYNAVCDAIPDLRCSMQYDYEQNKIPNFEEYYNIVKNKLC